MDEWREIPDGYKYEMNAAGDIRCLDSGMVIYCGDYQDEFINLLYMREVWVPADEGGDAGQTKWEVGMTVFDRNDMEEMREYLFPELVQQ